MTDPAMTPPSLRVVTQDLTLELRKVRRAIRVQNALLAGAVAVLVVAIGAVGWVTWDNHLTTEKLQKVTAQNRAEIAEANRMWCPVLGAIIQPSGPPPTTERGQVMVDLMSDLFVAYGCNPADLPPAN